MKRRRGHRVLMLLENDTFPNDSRVRYEASALIEAGYQVSLICPSEKGQPWRECCQGVHVLRFPKPAAGNGVLGYLWEYGFSLTATAIFSIFVFIGRGFDVIHAHNPPDFFVVIAAFYKLFGKRFVFDHHDLSPEMYYARFEGQGNRLIHRVLLFFEWLSCRMANHIITTNESYKKLEHHRNGVPTERITVVRNGPRLENFQTSKPDPELRSKASTIIGYVGMMGYQDGLDYLIRAVKHLVDDLGRTDVYCVLLGKGDALDDLKELTTQLGLNDYIWFPGYITGEKFYSYLATADIFVAPDPKNPYNDRSTMIKMMEYMAAGSPIVAFDLTEHRVSAQDAALYAEPNDTLDFARQIARLIDDPALRNHLGTTGRERVESCLSWPHQKQQLIEAYEKMTT